MFAVSSLKGESALEKIKVAIADDNKELVKTLESYLSSHPQIEVITTAPNGRLY